MNNIWIRISISLVIGFIIASFFNRIFLTFFGISMSVYVFVILALINSIRKRKKRKFVLKKGE